MTRTLNTSNRPTLERIAPCLDIVRRRLAVHREETLPDSRYLQVLLPGPGLASIRFRTSTGLACVMTSEPGAAKTQHTIVCGKGISPRSFAISCVVRFLRICRRWSRL